MKVEEKTIDYLSWVKDSPDDQSRELRRLEFHDWYDGLSKDEKELAQRALDPEKKDILAKLDKLEARIKAELAEPDITLERDGKVYRIGEWLTVKEYAKEHGYKPTRVINWIHRGIIPDDCITVFPELGNLRLLRNLLYKEA